jgi:hypothetical protein
MRNTALIIAVLAGFAPPAAWAADGRLGAVSGATVTIRVSVAPRAWQAGDGALCVRGPVSGYSLRIEGDSNPQPFATAATGACPMRAEELMLLNGAVAGRGTLLIVPQ